MAEHRETSVNNGEVQISVESKQPISTVERPDVYLERPLAQGGSVL